MDNDFASRLVFLRKAKNLSQAKLSEILNISQQAIAKWEKGQREPTLSMICTIAEFFCVSTDYLLGFSASGFDESKRVSRNTQNLIQIFESVNTTGQKKNIEYANDIAGNPSMQKDALSNDSAI